MRPSLRPLLVVFLVLLAAPLVGCERDTRDPSGPADSVADGGPSPADAAPDAGADAATPDGGADSAPTPTDTNSADAPPSTLPRGCDGADLPGVPDDPGLPGPWAVGARAVTVAGLPGEVWYPAAPGSAAGVAPHRYDVRPYLPEADRDKIPDEQNPWQACDCYRDLPLDEGHGPYPLLVFVHGTAGYPMQSVEHVVHWASRGFVVLAVEHRGLRLADILTFQIADRDVEGDLRALLTAAQAPSDDLAFLDGSLDTTRVGLTGHSFGGAAIKGFGGWPGVRVLLPMTGGGVDPPTGDSELELSVILGALDDGIIPWSRLEDAFQLAPTPRLLVGLANAGHLAPTSLCALGADRGGLLEIAVANGVTVPSFIAILATDGCAPDQLPPAEGWAAINAVTAAALEHALHCTGALPDLAPALEARYDAFGVFDLQMVPPPPVASGTPFPWSEESDDAACANGADDDGNGYADCDDFACSRNVAVWVCGAAASYEASPDACANGGDDDGDGLADCADPDCGENPFHTVCPAPLVESACVDGVDDDGDGFSGCDDADCLLAGADGCDASAYARVLFDQTLDETSAAGPNSDWVVDGFNARPTPSNPDGPDAWVGALSGFGYALWASGDYLVESLPSPTGALTWDDGTNPQDLSRYDVLVLFEPSRAIGADERAAILHFLDAGGGLLLVANHLGADRDGNGVSAPQALNGLLDDETLGPDPFGFRFDEVDIDTGRALDAVTGDHPVTDGPAGVVGRVGFYQGCSAHLTGANPTARGLVHLPAAPDADHGIAVGVAEVGAGRVVFVTDSAIGGDGTDSHGNANPSHDSWNDAGQDNATLFLNAIAWLSGR